MIAVGCRSRSDRPRHCRLPTTTTPGCPPAWCVQVSRSGPHRQTTVAGTQAVPCGASALCAACPRPPPRRSLSPNPRASKMPAKRDRLAIAKLLPKPAFPRSCKLSPTRSPHAPVHHTAGRIYEDKYESNGSDNKVNRLNWEFFTESGEKGTGTICARRAVGQIANLPRFWQVGNLPHVAEGKGDRQHLCAAPYGPFRQMVPVSM